MILITYVKDWLENLVVNISKNSMIVFKNIITSTVQGLESRINEVLTTFPDLHMEYQINWSDNICSKSRFKSFAIDKLSISMAYGVELTPRNDAVKILENFIDSFKEDCRFYTNWDDVENTEKELCSWTSMTKSTFDCCLLIMDDRHVGIIIITDED